MNRTQKIKKIISDNLAIGGIKRCIDELNYRRFVGTDGYKGRWTRGQVMSALNGSAWEPNSQQVSTHIPKKIHQILKGMPGSNADFMRTAIMEKLRREKSL